MDAFDAYGERMARGESDPAILAAMARVAKATQHGMEKAKQQAQQSKEDFEARRRQLGPNQQLIIQKVDDICPTLQQRLEAIWQAVEDIPRGTFMETLTQRSTSGLSEKIDRSVNGVVVQFQALLDSQTQGIPTIEQIEGSVRDRTAANRDAIDENLKRLKVDLQEAISSVLADAVKGLLTTADGKQIAAETISEIKAATTEEAGLLRQAVESTKNETLSKIEDSGVRTLEEVNSVRSGLIATKEEFLSQLNSSNTDNKQGIERIRTALDQATKAASGMIDSVRNRTRQGLDDIERALEAQSSKLVSIQDRVEQVATSTHTMEDTFDKSKTESEGAWNRTIEMMQNGFAAQSSTDGLLDAKQAILIKLDDQAQLRNAQLSDVENAFHSSLGEVQTRLGQLEQGLAERPTQNMLTSTLTGQLDHAVNILGARIAGCENKAINSLEYHESVEKQRELFKKDLEDCQTTICQAVQTTTDRVERLLSDKVSDQLQQEFKTKLEAKDQEIRRLSEMVESLTTSCNDKEAIKQLLQQQLSTHEGRLKDRDDLCLAREDALRQALSKEALSHQDTLTNFNNREKKSELDLKEATDKAEAAENELSRLGHRYDLKLEEVADLKKELDTQKEEAEEEERVHLGEIVWLKERIRAPFEANEIAKTLHDMALQVIELDIYPCESRFGPEFVNELASQLLSTGSAGHFTHFVQEVTDEEWRCFIDVCNGDNASPLPNETCDRHGNECPKVWVDQDKAPDKKVVYFEG